jgi:hypothetical protein
MIHTIRYFGNFEQSFRQLRAETDVYFDRKGKTAKPVGKVSDKVNGLVFRYMQMPGKDEFVAVGVERIVLRAPVLLVTERHTDGKGFFEDPLFGDDSAMRLLVDMIIANPERRDALGRLLRGLGKSPGVSKKTA